MEACSQGSAPIAADLLTRAGAPGNSFAFLMTGVATDYTEIMVLKETRLERGNEIMEICPVPAACHPATSSGHLLDNEPDRGIGEYLSAIGTCIRNSRCYISMHEQACSFVYRGIGAKHRLYTRRQWQH